MKYLHTLGTKSSVSLPKKRNYNYFCKLIMTIFNTHIWLIHKLNQEGPNTLHYWSVRQLEEYCLHFSRFSKYGEDFLI